MATWLFRPPRRDKQGQDDIRSKVTTGSPTKNRQATVITAPMPPMPPKQQRPSK